MSNTLEILGGAHRALLDYEKAQAAKRGPRTPEQRREILPVLEAHRDAWLQNGGAAQDFLLTGLLAECEAPPNPSAPRGAEGASESEASTGTAPIRPSGDGADGSENDAPEITEASGKEDPPFDGKTGAGHKRRRGSP